MICNASMRDGPSGEAKISLRFATAGREEEEIDSLAIGVLTNRTDPKDLGG